MTDAGTLYIVGTPIGNLGDMSPRAVEVLQLCDFIAAEDTRVTAKLLNHFDIKKPMTSCHKFNIREKGDEIVNRLLAGESCALVTDAGMPCISDPGEELVALCHEKCVPVRAVPGPSAIVTALAVSGMPSGRFTFEGFLTTAKPNRKKHLEELVDEKRTMIFYEAPHKLTATLRDMLVVLGDRKIALVRELTKIYEEIELTTFSEAYKKYTERSPKGEFVIIISGAQETEESAMTLEEAVNYAKELTNSGAALNDAAKKAAAVSGIKKNEIYKLLVGRKEI